MIEPHHGRGVATVRNGGGGGIFFRTNFVIFSKLRRNLGGGRNLMF